MSGLPDTIYSQQEAPLPLPNLTESHRDHSSVRPCISGLSPFSPPRIFIMIVTRCSTNGRCVIVSVRLFLSRQRPKLSFPFDLGQYGSYQVLQFSLNPVISLSIQRHRPGVSKLTLAWPSPRELLHTSPILSASSEPRLSIAALVYVTTGHQLTKEFISKSSPFALATPLPLSQFFPGGRFPVPDFFGTPPPSLFGALPPVRVV